MSEVLVLVDHLGGEVRKSTFEMLTIARRLGTPSAVFVGAQSDDVVRRLAEYGAQKVYFASASEFDDYLVIPKVDLLAQIVESAKPIAVLLAGDGEYRDIAARLAVRTNSGVITDAMDVQADGTVTKNVFAATYTVQAKSQTSMAIICIKGNGVAPETAPATPDVVQFTAQFSDLSRVPRVTDVQPRAKSGRPELTQADIVGQLRPFT